MGCVGEGGIGEGVAEGCCWSWSCACVISGGGDGDGSAGCGVVDGGSRPEISTRMPRHFDGALP